MTTNRPVTTIREGAIGLSVWQREGKHGTFFEFTISRCFQASNGTFGYSTSFHESNVEALEKAIKQAAAWIREHREAAGIPATSVTNDSQTTQEAYD